jgi:hypothetical protein
LKINFIWGYADKELFDDWIETAGSNHIEPRSGYQTSPWVYSVNKNEYYVKLVRWKASRSGDMFLPKNLLHFNRLHGVISQKIQLFLMTAERT